MIQIFDGGIHTKHNRCFIMKRKHGLPEFLLLFIKSEAVFILNGIKTIVSPPSIVLINQKTAYEYANPNGAYIDSWLHFNLNNKNDFPSLDILGNQFFTCRKIPQLETYLEKILWEKEYASTTFKEKNIELLFQLLVNNLIDAYEQKDHLIHNHPYYYSFQELRLKMQVNPTIALSANEVANTLKISVSHFHHLYKAFFQTTFKNDFIRFRIEYVKKMLLTTDLTIEEIMIVCGYQTAVHFYRQFKQITGTTPSDYRKNNER